MISFSDNMKESPCGQMRANGSPYLRVSLKWLYITKSFSVWKKRMSFPPFDISLQPEGKPYLSSRTSPFCRRFILSYSSYIKEYHLRARHVQLNLRFGF